MLRLRFEFCGLVFQATLTAIDVKLCVSQVGHNKDSMTAVEVFYYVLVIVVVANKAAGVNTMEE